jgi:hypothetical protein
MSTIGALRCRPFVQAICQGRGAAPAGSWQDCVAQLGVWDVCSAAALTHEQCRCGSVPRMQAQQHTLLPESRASCASLAAVYTCQGGLTQRHWDCAAACCKHIRLLIMRGCCRQ